MILQTFLQLSLTSRALKYLDLSHFKTNFQTLWPLSKVDLEQCFIRLAPFSKEKKRFECSQNECEDDGHATRKKSIISHYVCGQNWICKQAYYHYLNCISSSEMMTASSSSPSFKILSREWMTLIHLFLCSFTKENVPRKRSVFSSSVYLFVNIAGMWYDGSAQLISFVSWNCRSNQQVENKPYHVPHVLMQL